MLFVDEFRFVSLVLAPTAFKPMASDPFHGNVAIDDFYTNRITKKIVQDKSSIRFTNKHFRKVFFFSFFSFRYNIHLACCLSNYLVRIDLIRIRIDVSEFVSFFSIVVWSCRVISCHIMVTIKPFLVFIRVNLLFLFDFFVQFRLGQ